MTEGPNSQVEDHISDLLTDSVWDHAMQPLHHFPKDRSKDVYKKFLSKVFQPAYGLQRAASVTSYTFEPQQVDDRLLPRSTSYSSLSPTHALKYTDRVATRYIPSSTAYKYVTGSRSKQRFPKKRSKPPSWYQEARRESQNEYRHWRTHKIFERDDPEPVVDTHRTRYNSPMPVDWSRSDRMFGYNTGLLRGWDRMLPLSHTNYDRRDDRDYMRYMTCRSMRGPYYARTIAGSRTIYRPYRVVIVA